MEIGRFATAKRALEEAGQEEAIKSLPIGKSEIKQVYQRKSKKAEEQALPENLRETPKIEELLQKLILMEDLVNQLNLTIPLGRVIEWIKGERIHKKKPIEAYTRSNHPMTWTCQWI